MPTKYSTEDHSDAKAIAKIVAKLRPYQVTGLQISKEKFHTGCRRQLLVNPTGCGKTVFFSTLPVYHQFKKRILVLVHRKELAKQAKEKILKWNPTFTVGIEKGRMRSAPTDRVVVASVQTLGRPERVKINGRCQGRSESRPV